MWKNKAVLTEDVFSFLSLGKHLPWMSHEWAMEVLLFGCSLLAPKWHIFLYCFILLLSLFLVLFLTHKKDWLKNIPFSILMVVLSLISFGNIAMPRPMMISNIFLAFTLFCCFDLYKNASSKYIFFLPLISFLWANFHGGSSNLSYLLPFFFGLVSLFSYSASKIECERKSVRTILTFFGIMIPTFFTIAINPHGTKMWIYPYQNMGNTYMLESIREWAPTTVSNPVHLPFFFFLTIIIFVLLKSERKIQIIDLLVIGIFTYLGLKSVRFWGYLYLASTFILFDYVKEVKTAKQTNYLLIGFSLFLSCLFFFSLDTTKRQLKEVPLSDKMIEEVKKLQVSRLYNFYDYGGYLIYKNIPVFIDGRADFYSDIGSYRDYFRLTHLEDGYEKVLDTYAFDGFLVKKSTRLYDYLIKENYKIIYQENEVALFSCKQEQ